MDILKIISVGMEESFNSKLKQVLDNKIEITKATVDTLSENQVENSVVIIHNSEAGDYDLLSLKQGVLKESFKIFYVTSPAVAVTSKDLLLSAGIRLLGEEEEEEEKIAKIVNNLIDFDKKDNLFVFYGADRKVGTSTIAQSIAYILSQREDLKVAFLDFSATIGENALVKELGLEESFGLHGLNSLKLKLQNNIVEDQELLDSMVRFENLFILTGITRFLDIRHYSIQMIQGLVERVKSLFDVVIIDSGSPSDNALNMAALLVTKNQFLITTTHLASLNHYKTFFDEILVNLGEEPKFTMILNNVGEISEELIKSVKENYSIQNVVAAIPKVENDRDEVTLLYRHSNRKDYANNTKKISNLIFSYLGQEPDVLSVKKKGLFGR